MQLAIHSIGDDNMSKYNTALTKPVITDVPHVSIPASTKPAEKTDCKDVSIPDKEVKQEEYTAEKAAEYHCSSENKTDTNRKFREQMIDIGTAWLSAQMKAQDMDAASKIMSLLQQIAVI